MVSLPQSEITRPYLQLRAVWPGGGSNRHVCICLYGPKMRLEIGAYVAETSIRVVLCTGDIARKSRASVLRACRWETEILYTRVRCTPSRNKLVCVTLCVWHPRPPANYHSPSRLYIDAAYHLPAMWEDVSTSPCDQCGTDASNGS